MSSHWNQEDTHILEMLDRLGSKEPTGHSADPAVAQLEREVVEILGRMPYGLAPVAPDPTVKARLLARIAATPQTPATAVPPRPAASAESGSAGASVLPYPAVAPPAASRWRTYALAAGVAACLLGMGALVARLSERDVQIAHLTSELGQVTSEARELELEQAELRKAQERLDMITIVARHVYPMHPVAATAAMVKPGMDKPGMVKPGMDKPGMAKPGMAKPPMEGPQPDGIVFVCGQHQQWYLNVQSLQPPPAGKEYNLWFLTDQGEVHGGVLEVKGTTGELDSRSMPPRTRGFVVTLEDVGQHQQPQGPTVILGDQAVSI